jgi:uncharacterized protein involved in outer membrane biogenesis
MASRRRWPFALLAILIAIPLAGFAALRLLASPEALASRLVAAVESATGRRLGIGGLEIAFSLRPGIVLHDIALANPPGASRAAMLTARRAAVELALVPLLSNRVEIARIDLDAPDLLLETDAQGRGNWQFRAPAGPPQPAPQRPPAAAAPPRAMTIAVDRLFVTDARIAFRGLPPVQLRTLEASAPLAGPVTARASLALRGHDIAVQARTGPLAAAAPIETSFTVTGPLAEARGALTLTPAARPRLAGRVEIARLDLPAAAPAPAPAAAPAPPAGAPAPPPPRDPRVIPDTPLPLGALRGFDAELAIVIASLNAGGATWRDISLPLTLEAGHARIAPLSLMSPGGSLAGAVALDAGATPPALHVTLAAPALDLGPLQQAFGQPVRITGLGEAEAELRAAGATLRALAGSLAGHVGLAMLDATLEPPLIEPIARALRARIGMLPPPPDRLPVACVALRGDAADGVLRIATVLLDAPAAKVAGSGTISLREETVALRLLHDVRAAGQTVRVAADVAGDFRNVQYRGVRAENLAEVVGGAASRLGGDLGAILGGLARGAAPPIAPLPDCATALAAARGGRQGRVPAPRAAPAEGTPAPQQPQDLLRGLFRR